MIIIDVTSIMIMMMMTIVRHLGAKPWQCCQCYCRCHHHYHHCHRHNDDNDYDEDEDEDNDDDEYDCQAPWCKPLAMQLPTFVALLLPRWQVDYHIIMMMEALVMMILVTMIYI